MKHLMTNTMMKKKKNKINLLLLVITLFLHMGIKLHDNLLLTREMNEMLKLEKVGLLTWLLTEKESTTRKE